MKLTNKQLKQIIKEEINKVLNEVDFNQEDFGTKETLRFIEQIEMMPFEQFEKEYKSSIGKSFNNLSRAMASRGTKEPNIIDLAIANKFPDEWWYKQMDKDLERGAFGIQTQPGRPYIQDTYHYELWGYVSSHYYEKLEQLKSKSKGIDVESSFFNR